MSNITKWEGSSAEDFGSIPMRPKLVRVRIGQPTSQDGEIGKFNFKGSGWPATSRLEHVVGLKFFASRVLYGETFKSAARCGSHNYHTPDEKYKDPISPSCQECPVSRWDREIEWSNDLIKQKRVVETSLKKLPSEKPLCNETLNLIAVDKRMMPMVFEFQKTQIRVANENLLNPLQYSGKRIFETAFDIELVEEKGKTGRWYEFRFSNFRPVEVGVDQLYSLYTIAKNSGQSEVQKIHDELDAEKQVVSDDEVPF